MLKKAKRLQFPEKGLREAGGAFPQAALSAGLELENSSKNGLSPQVKQRVFYGAETLAKLLILNGLLKLAETAISVSGSVALGHQERRRTWPAPGGFGYGLASTRLIRLYEGGTPPVC
jgi:hypothetical protein